RYALSSLCRSPSAPLPGLHPFPTRRSSDLPMILRDALRVLIANWDGSYTVPSRTLYPHQWSWDSAFIAVGNARWSPRRARTELLDRKSTRLNSSHVKMSYAVFG